MLENNLIVIIPCTIFLILFIWSEFHAAKVIRKKRLEKYNTPAILDNSWFFLTQKYGINEDSKINQNVKITDKTWIQRIEKES